MRLLSLLLLALLLAPAWAQSPSASPSPAQHIHDEHCDHEHEDEHEPTEEEILERHHHHGQEEEVQAGGEYTNAGLHAQVENAPALYKFMIRETNSEPFRLKGQSQLVWRDTAVVCALNLLIIFWFYRRRQ